jgi:hypothetical protein
MKNVNKFVKTVIEMETFLKNTGNRYKVVSQRPYMDHSGKAGSKGATFTLLILEDSTDYGIDSRTGIQRDNNVYETFDVTILDGITHHGNLKKGDMVSLHGFIGDLSYAIDFNLILRFSSIQKINERGNKNE